MILYIEKKIIGYKCTANPLTIKQVGRTVGNHSLTVLEMWGRGHLAGTPVHFEISQHVLSQCSEFLDA